MPSFLVCEDSAVDLVLPFSFFDFSLFLRTFGGVEDRDEELGAGDSDGISRAPVCCGFFSGPMISRRGNRRSDKYVRSEGDGPVK